MNRLRKALVAGVMFTTVFTMSAVIAPGVNAAAAAGDLIKMEGLSSVYYLGADNKRYVFPNETTYFSWYDGFSSVKVIPQSELESYSLGKNVTMRPGTKLVKITTDPKVYAVLPNGQLKWLPSEAVASALYGTTWNKHIVDVPDAFFTNYTIASGQLAETAYPAGQLIKLPTASDVYYIDADGKARKIMSESAFLANRFKWADIVTTAAGFTLPTAGADLTGAESAIIDTSSGAGGQAGAGSGLTVALSGDTPASRNVPSYSTLVPFLVVNFTAASDGDVTVNNLTLTRKGTGLAADFDGGYLYVGDTRLTTKRSVNTSDNTITFTALNMNVPAGTTKSVTLKMNAKTSATVQGNHYFELTNASAVDTNGAVVSGSFPISGNIMSYSTVPAATVVLDGTETSYNYKVGETNVIVSEFTIENSSATEAVNIYRIRLKDGGDTTDTAVGNYSLDLDGTVVKTGVSMVGNYVDFILDTPFELKKSRNIAATVRGDILEDINKDLELYLQNSVDAEIRGTAYGDFYSAYINSAAFDTPYGTGAGDGDEVNIQGSEINVSFDGPQAQETKDDTQDVVLANFKVKSMNLGVNIETLTLTLYQSAAMNNLPMDNVEMVDEGNNVSYSASDSGTASSATRTLLVENVLLQKGVQYNFEIRGDIQDGTNAGATFSVYIAFSGMTARFQDADETTVVVGDLSSVTLTGKTMTVAAPGIDFAKVTTSDATYVKNAMGVLLYKGKITANSVDNLKVSKVKLDGSTGSTALISDCYSKLYLNKVNSDGSETTLDTETSLGVTEVTFSGFTLEVLKGTSNGVYVVIRGDVKNSPDAETISFNWVTYSTTDYTVRDSDNNTVTAGTASANDGQLSTIASAGTFTMTFDSTETGTNAAKNVLAGTQVLVGRLKLTATKEAAKVEDFTLQNMLGTATQDDIAYLKLYGESGMTTLLGTANLDTSKRAMFEDVNIEIPITGTKYVYVAATLKPIDYSVSKGADSTGASERTIKLDIASSTGYTVKTLGVSTGDVLDNTGVASTTQTVVSTMLGATMSNITSAFANDLLSNGPTYIFSFKVTAPASSNIDSDGGALPFRLDDVTFKVSTSSGITLTTFQIERVGGSNGLVPAKNAAGAATAIDGSNFVIDFSQSYATTTQTDIDVNPGETAEYKIRATVGGVGTSASLKVTIEGVDTYVKFYHGTGVLGVYSADTASYAPRLPGITTITAGSLTN